MKICFTGRRKIKGSIDFINNESWKQVTENIYDYLFELMDSKPNEEFHFISGGALGTDLLAFVTIEIIKEMHPQFKIINELAVPFKGYEEKWSDDWKLKLSTILTKANKVTLVSEIEKYKSNNAFQQLNKRNEYMIDESDLVIAVWDSIEKGGTWNAIRYARKHNKEIKYILFD